jgi:hypothetical protein
MSENEKSISDRIADIMKKIDELKSRHIFTKPISSQNVNTDRLLKQIEDIENIERNKHKKEN